MEQQRGTAHHRPRTTERRSGTRDMVKKLIAERTEMLALYCKLGGLEPYNVKGKVSRTKPPQEQLQEFCQVLVDYIAAGHFSLYERIVNGTERRQKLSTLAERLYPKIAATTEAALDFNDKYDCGDHCEITAAFPDDLSKLGEMLASRIEVEDEMLRHLVVSRRESASR